MLIPVSKLNNFIVNNSTRVVKFKDKEYILLATAEDYSWIVPKNYHSILRGEISKSSSRLSNVEEYLNSARPESVRFKYDAKNKKVKPNKSEENPYISVSSLDVMLVKTSDLTVNLLDENVSVMFNCFENTDFTMSILREKSKDKKEYRYFVLLSSKYSNSTSATSSKKWTEKLNDVLKHRINSIDILEDAQGNILVSLVEPEEDGSMRGTFPCYTYLSSTEGSRKKEFLSIKISITDQLIRALLLACGVRKAAFEEHMAENSKLRLPVTGRFNSHMVNGESGVFFNGLNLSKVLI